MKHAPATAALEHFTATFAQLLLSSGDARALFGHDEIRNLFLWHALEEAEHKAVAFDVYNKSQGRPSITGLFMRNRGKKGSDAGGDAVEEPSAASEIEQLDETIGSRS